MDDIEVVVAHSKRATMRVGDVFLKVDADQARAEAEIEAMEAAPIPTAEILPRQMQVTASGRWGLAHVHMHAHQREAFTAHAGVGPHLSKPADLIGGDSQFVEALNRLDALVVRHRCSPATQARS